MSLFAVGHAVHADWRTALAQAASQVDAQRAAAPGAAGAGPATLGFVYFTDAYAAHADELLAALRARWPGASWVGGVGVGVIAGGAEAIDEPALALLLSDIPAGRFEVYSGARRLGHGNAWSALVHADPATPELSELIAELADRTASGYLFGGLAAGRGGCVHIADGVWRGGLSGVAFDADVALVSRVTQGCQPVGPSRRITEAERNVVAGLDDAPALATLLRDLDVASGTDPRAALPRLAGTLVGLSDAADEPLARGGQFGADVRVRHLVGIDPARNAIAVADLVHTGQRLAFCRRDVDAARRDLVRACSEVRDEIEATPGRTIQGAIYVSCAGRGGPHFGAPSAEAQIVRRALGAVPLVGFFAAGEIARHHVYGYTGVLTVFTAQAGAGAQP